MVANYILIYTTNDGLKRIEIPIEVNEDTDADHVYEMCYEYLQKNTKTGGLPTSAVSTMKQYPSYCFSTSNEVCEECHNLKDSKTPESKNTSREDMGSRVWCLVDSLDNSPEQQSTTWIPGIQYKDGSITSVLGNLTSPDSPDDIKPFNECPFPGYVILKEKDIHQAAESLKPFPAEWQPCIVTALITPYLGFPFLFTKEIPVMPDLSDSEQEEYLRRMIQRYIVGNKFSITLYYYRIVPVFGDFSYPAHTFKSILRKDTDYSLNHYLVRFEVDGQEDSIMACVVPMPHLQRNVHIYPPFYIRRNIEQMYPGKIIRLVDVECRQDYVTDLPVILEKDFLPSK